MEAAKHVIGEGKGELLALIKAVEGVEHGEVGQ